MKIALAGNPNSGKTTMFNALTGSNEKVGNWAGVTVDKKENLIKKKLSGGEKIVAVDLPGAYSMSPFTSEESITRDFVKNANPDVIINIVDATNLSRSLFFTTQLLELGIPMVVALNKMDLNDKNDTKIDADELSSRLGVPVFHTVSTSSKGLREVVTGAIGQIGKKPHAPISDAGLDTSDRQVMEAADRNRFKFVNEIVSDVERRAFSTKDKTIHDKIDTFLTNRYIGIGFFAIVMFLVFQISQAWVGPAIAEGYQLKNGTHIPGLVTLIEALHDWLGALLNGANPLLYALLIDGIIGGVGAVVGFLPLVMVMYFLLSLLEDCGYMARVSVVLDPIFKKVGLSGKSVIPFIVGTGCSVPGIMACRTIRDERERRAAAMLTPFMPCGAKLPVIALFAGAFFKDSAWVGTMMYFAGILMIFLCALLVNKITATTSKRSYFIIELPDYKGPSFKRALGSMLERGKEYIIKAGTVILLCNTAIQIMQSFTPALKIAETPSSSILAVISHPFAYLLYPVIGYHAWQFAAAAISGFIAKENVVATIAVCYAISDITAELPSAAPMLSASAALAYLMFNLFTPPCFAAIGAMHAELKSGKWLFGALALQLSVGFTAGFLVYQIGTLITSGTLGNGFLPGALAVLVMGTVIVILCQKAKSRR